MGKKRSRHQNPKAFLASDDDHFIVSKKRSKPSKQHQQSEQLISSIMSSKILKEALIQQKEIQDDAEERSPNNLIYPAHDAVSDEGDIDEFVGFSDTRSQRDFNEEEINKEDEVLLDTFLSDSALQHRLADVIAKKINEKDGQVFSEVRPLPLEYASIDLYKRAGKLLSRYTAGKIPLVVKRIPSLQRWEEVLSLTEPENWTPNAMYQVTRIFASNLKDDDAGRFYKLVLLPRVRKEIRKSKILHFALIQSLRKCLYKPSAFFKGILLPLCESRTCNLKEAHIIGSILKRNSIPKVNASAALKLLAEMEYFGKTSYLIKKLLEKRYELSHSTITALVTYFMSYRDDSRIMPVIWHQSLLTFVESYKRGFSKEDKYKLRALVGKQMHNLITPEIYRELDDQTSTYSLPPVINKAIKEDRFDYPEVPMEGD